MNDFDFPTDSEFVAVVGAFWWCIAAGFARRADSDVDEEKIEIPLYASNYCSLWGFQDGVSLQHSIYSSAAYKAVFSLDQQKFEIVDCQTTH